MFHLIRLFYAYTIFLRLANEAHERRLLTNVEYILEGRFHTREQLNLLRQNCQRMPVMKTWHVAGAQSNTHRYHVYAYITSKTCRCLDFCLSMLVQTTVIKSFTCIISLQDLLVLFLAKTTSHSLKEKNMNGALLFILYGPKKTRKTPRDL